MATVISCVLLCVCVGMQVLLHSECVEALGCEGWRRVGEGVRYTKSTQSQLHYTLSWSMVHTDRLTVLYCQY